jgi:hypothetical protein
MLIIFLKTFLTKNMKGSKNKEGKMISLSMMMASAIKTMEVKFGNNKILKHLKVLRILKRENSM